MRARPDLDSDDRRARRRLVILWIIVAVLTIIGAGAELLSHVSDKIVWGTVSGGFIIALLIRIRIATRY